MKPILALETSSPVLSVAYTVTGKKITEKTIHGFMKHAENILPAIESLLKKEKNSINSVGTFLIGQGPGSFTGLRVGYATLKGFLTLSPRPCYGLLSLDLIAENFSDIEGKTLCVALDARRQMVFSRLYKKSKTGWVASGKPQILPATQWAQSLPTGILLAGEACKHYRHLLDKQTKKNFHFLPESQGYPKAKKMLEAFLKSPKDFQKLQSPKDFIPLYFRLSEAEERMNAGELKRHRRPSIHVTSC